MNGRTHAEQGRELKAPELKARTVVMIAPPDRGFLITMWVSSIDMVNHTVSFYSAPMQWICMNRYDQNGVIYDDQGRTVRVYEYLGEI